MAHSYVSTLIHYIFSTKNRQKIIKPDFEKRMWSYIGGISKENKIKALGIGGTEDHIHLLLSLPSTLSISKSIQLIKGGSSKWVHDIFPEYKDFAWQEGYGAFSVSISHIEETSSYINNQKNHHKIHTFQEEYLNFLKKHNISYDEKYVWG